MSYKKFRYLFRILQLLMALMLIGILVLQGIGINTCELLKIYLLVLWTSSLYLFLCHYKFNHTYSLLMWSMMLFIINPVIFDLLGDIQLTEINKFMVGEFSEETVSSVLLLICFCILGINIGVAYYNPSHSLLSSFLRDNPKDELIKKKIVSIVWLIILILLPFNIYKTWLEFQNVLINGYLAAFITEDRAPFILRFSWYLLKLLFPLLFIISMSRKRFLSLTLIYLLINIFSILQGARSSLLVPLSFFLWYYYKFYNTKGVNIKKAIIAFACLLFINHFFMNLRGETSKMNLTPIGLAKSFLLSQGVTFQVNGYYIDNKDKIPSPSSLYCFSPFLDFASRLTDPHFATKKDDYTVHKTYSLGDKLMYQISPTGYYSGNGLGSSFIAELHAIGNFPALLLGGIILGILIMGMEIRVQEGSLFVLFMWFWIQNIVWMPRGGLFSYLVQFILSYFLYKLLSIVTKRTDLRLSSKPGPKTTV